jgi:hypothetical protein
MEIYCLESFNFFIINIFNNYYLLLDLLFDVHLKNYRFQV